MASFNGHYVVRGGDVQALEGEPPKGYIVVIGFDSVQKAREAGMIRQPMRRSGHSGKNQPRAAYLLSKARPSSDEAYGLINTGKKGCSMFVSELRSPEANNRQNTLSSCLAPLSG